jgi:WD40 repeat protein
LIKKFGEQRSSYRIDAISFSKDGKTIAAGYANNIVVIWGIDGQIKSQLDVLAPSSANSKETLKQLNQANEVLLELDNKVVEAYQKTRRPNLASITSLAFSDKEQTIIVGSTDSTLRIWSLAGKLLHTFRSKVGPVNTISVSDNGEQYLTTHLQPVALLWNKNGNIVNKIRGHLSPIISANFTKNNQMITVGTDGMIRVHGEKSETHLVSPAAFRRRDYIYATAISPDGKLVLSLNNQNKAQVWDLSTPVYIERIYHLDNSPVTALAFSAKGNLFVSGGKNLDRIQLWDSTGQLLRTYATKDFWGANALAFAPDSQSFLAACSDGKIFHWHIDGAPIQLLSGGSKPLIDVAFNPNGKEAISVGADSTIMIWDLQGGELIRKISTQTAISSALISSTGEQVLIGDKMGNVAIWETSGKRGSVIISGQKPITSMDAWQNDRILIGFEDNSTSLWDFQGKILQQITPASPLAPRIKYAPVLAIAANGEKLFISTENRGIIKDLVNDTLFNVKINPNVATFTHQGNRLILGFNNNGISFWDTQGKQKQVVSDDPIFAKALVFPPEKNQFLTISSGGDISEFDFSLKKPSRYAEDYTFIAFDPDTTRGYTLVGSTNGFVHLLGDKQQILWSKKVSNSYGINCLAFSPDGKILFIGRRDIGNVQLRDIDGKLIGGSFGHHQAIASVAFAPDGTSFITGSLDSTAVLWDLLGNALQTFKGHLGAVNSIAFAPDGKSVLTGGSDALVKHWDLNGKLLQSFHTQSLGVNSVAFSPDGKHILTGNKDSTKPGTLWDLKGKLIRAFYENISVTEAVDAKFSPDGKYIVILLQDYVIVAEDWQPK